VTTALTSKDCDLAEMPQIAVLAGGLATRMRPLTETIPKALIPVAGEPFAVHQLRLLRRNGFHRILFLIGYRGEQIIERLGDGSSLGLSISYLSDGPELRGTAGSIVNALPMLDTNFGVIYGDSWLDFDYRAAVSIFRSNSKPALMTVISAQIGSESPNVEYAEGRVLRYKKGEKNATMKHIDYGFSIFTRKIFEDLPLNQTIDLATVQENLASRGQLLGFETKNRYYEVGSKVGRQELEDHFLGKLL
jgi:NDP-sugar pyrophosphorylase family protein